MSTLTNNENHQLPILVVKEDIIISVKENMQSNTINTTNSDHYNTKSNATNTLSLKKAPPPTSSATSTMVDSSMSNMTGTSGIVLSDAVVRTTITTDVTGTTDAGSSSIVAIQKEKQELPKVLRPTYKSSEESVYYTTAKALLQSGDFETALSTIEDGIEWTKQQLLAKDGSDHNQTTTDIISDDSCTLHQSMAPFHYLYGTTLLYSIEESTDGMQPLTTVEGSSATVQVPDDDEEGDEGEPHSGTSSQYYANDDEPEPDDNQAAAVEDMEIAWENLDTARTILEQMLLVDPKSDKLRADMGQILLREGDLQRQNGAYIAAVADYTSCLSYYEENTLIPRYCRKIADVHCNLGAVHFNLVVETKKGPAAGESGNNNTEIEERDRPAKIIFYRNRGFHHYYECAKTLVGMISKLSNTDSYELFQRVDTDHSIQYPYCNDRSDEYPTLMRSKLTTLRQLVTALTKTMDASLSIDDSDLINDSLAVLEEIQETVDESETSEQGVVEATAMKDEIAALVAAQQHNDDEVDAAAANGTTTTSNHQNKNNAFGSASAAASTAIAQTIMIVKKKKKRTEEELIDEDGMDVKLPARVDANDNKRMKSSE